jgi:hypothetical protein
VVYPQTITYIVYCHAKFQLKVILGSLWVVVGSLWVVVGRCGSLWVDVVGSLWIVVGRSGSLLVVVDRSSSSSSSKLYLNTLPSSPMDDFHEGRLTNYI